MEKKYSAIVEVSWLTSFEAEDEKQFRRRLKEQFKQDYNIEITNAEIKSIEEEVTTNIYGDIELIAKENK
tara:strand:- start:1665 stop:1874 length:210 start_codon:yes stop_codon:yes gene_type:complete